jgi:glycosyltransferase involved in cell wall biosynthesis
VHLGIATLGQTQQHEVRQTPHDARFIFAGNLLPLKGVHLAIRAFAEVRTSLPNATFRIVGDGPSEGQLRETARKYGVYGAVEFAGTMRRSELLCSLQNYTALVFPSLHDSGGFVVLEALQQGTPVICLDRGGPGSIVNSSCGVVIKTLGADEGQVIADLAEAMISLGTMPPDDFERLSKGAVMKAQQFTWERLTAHVVGGNAALRRAMSNDI